MTVWLSKQPHLNDSATKDAPGYQRHPHEERKCDTRLGEDLKSFGVAARHPGQNSWLLCKCFTDSTSQPHGNV